MLSNPPFGDEWKKIEREVRKEAEEKGFNGRFGPGLPRVSDGSLLFLLHLISKMRPIKEGGSRFGIVMNGSPLFTAGAEICRSEETASDVKRSAAGESVGDWHKSCAGNLFSRPGFAAISVDRLRARQTRNPGTNLQSPTRRPTLNWACMSPVFPRAQRFAH